MHPYKEIGRMPQTVNCSSVARRHREGTYCQGNFFSIAIAPAPRYCPHCRYSGNVARKRIIRPRAGRFYGRRLRRIGAIRTGGPRTFFGMKLDMTPAHRLVTALLQERSLKAWRQRNIRSMCSAGATHRDLEQRCGTNIREDSTIDSRGGHLMPPLRRAKKTSSS